MSLSGHDEREDALAASGRGRLGILLDMLGMSQLWENSRPRLTNWFARIKARPTFKPALLEWCPPDLTADLLTYGRQSWPSVERLLAQA
jgi:hypothetical protein